MAVHGRRDGGAERAAVSAKGSNLSPDERAHRRAQREARARYAAAHLECCRDATSVVDWHFFRKHHHQDWHRVLRDCFRVEPTPDTSLEEYLRMGAGGLLLARSRDDTTIPKKRKAARHVAEVLGHLLLAELDEEGLEQARGDYVKTLGGRRAHALITHDLRILRQAAERGREALALPSVTHAWPNARPRGRKKKNPRPRAASPRDVLRLLAQLDLIMRAAVALIVGVGLRIGELLLLRVGDLDMIGKQVRLRGGPGRGTVHRALPEWTLLLIWEAWPRLMVMPPGALLFGSPKQPGKPRSDLAKRIKLAAIAAGLMAEGESNDAYTPRGLRRLYQAVARANDPPSALVRGTLGKHLGRGEGPAMCLDVDRELARRWVELLRTPGVGVDERAYVPRKAPKGVGRWDAERRPRVVERRRVWSLPPGCLGQSPGKNP
jgi:integrase